LHYHLGFLILSFYHNPNHFQTFIAYAVRISSVEKRKNFFADRPNNAGNAANGEKVTGSRAEKGAGCAVI